MAKKEMTEEEMALQRFVAEADGIKIQRPQPLPDWNAVLREAQKEKNG